MVGEVLHYEPNERTCLVERQILVGADNSIVIDVHRINHSHFPEEEVQPNYSTVRRNSGRSFTLLSSEVDNLLVWVTGKEILQGNDCVVEHEGIVKGAHFGPRKLQGANVESTSKRIDGEKNR